MKIFILIFLFGCSSHKTYHRSYPISDTGIMYLREVSSYSECKSGEGYGISGPGPKLACVWVEEHE